MTLNDLRQQLDAEGTTLKPTVWGMPPRMKRTASWHHPRDGLSITSNEGSEGGKSISSLRMQPADTSSTWCYTIQPHTSEHDADL